MLRWMLPLGVGLVVLWALPVQAEDEEATPAKLRERIQTLETQNATLVKLLDLSQQQVQQMDEARQLTQELLEATNETVKAFRERVTLGKIARTDRNADNFHIGIQPCQERKLNFDTVLCLVRRRIHLEAWNRVNEGLCKFRIRL